MEESARRLSKVHDIEYSVLRSTGRTHSLERETQFSDLVCDVMVPALHSTYMKIKSNKQF